jgi:hypothetical protein
VFEALSICPSYLAESKNRAFADFRTAEDRKGLDGGNDAKYEYVKGCMRSSLAALF